MLVQLQILSEINRVISLCFIFALFLKFEVGLLNFDAVVFFFAVRKCAKN